MDLQHLRASDGTGEAVLAHIQSVRNPGSTVLDLDNVDNWNSKAIVLTGTPAANGFISPVGMKVMYGHLNAGDFIIDGYAPGYVDNGNTTAEVAIVKMTTSWSDTLISLLGVSLQDNGKLKTTSLDDFLKPSEINSVPFVASGAIVAISAGLIGTFSNAVFYNNTGLRFTKTAVPNKTYTASKDTYVDIDPVSNGTVIYTEVANGAAAPALTAGYIRVAKVVTSGAAITSILQRYMDSLGNLYRPLAKGTKYVDANGYTVYEEGTFRRYRKRLTFSQTIAGLAVLAVSSNLLPEGMPNIGAAFMGYSFQAQSNAGVLQIVWEGSTGSTALQFTAASTDASSRGYTGILDMEFTTS